MNMQRKNLFLFVCMALVSTMDGQSSGGPTHGKVVVCYIATWAVYRPPPGKFRLEDLEPSLCTHLVYAFAGLNATNSSIVSLDPWQDLPDNNGLAGYRRLVGLKKRYPHLKVTIAIGGWNEGSLKYSQMAESGVSRQKFIKSVLQFLMLHGFDGLDLDWEYPTKRDGRPQDKANFVTLVKELKEAFEPHRYILTAALGVGKDTMDSAYDLPKLSRYLDLIHMMCYDYHGKWDGVVGPNAPLEGIDDKDPLSVEYTIEYMMKHGVSPSKMVLGMPMYGRSFLLQDPDEHVIKFGHTLTKNESFAGPFTREAGFMGYNEICREVRNKTSMWKEYWDEASSTPYIHHHDRVVTYDNERSISAKVKMTIDYNLRGFMVWSIDTDDFLGECVTAETDPYIDFKSRYSMIKDDPLLFKALKTLNLHEMNSQHIGRDVYYFLSNGRLQLRIPTPEFSNFPLMRTINEAAHLALEEKRIRDEMGRVSRQNEIVDTQDTTTPKKPNSSSISRVCPVNVLLFLIVISNF